VKHSKNVHASISLDQIGDAVMPVQENAHILARVQIAMTQFGILRQCLCPLEYALDRAIRRIGIIRGDVLEDVLEPAECFACPGYLRHDRMRRSISWFEMVRRASESARPR